jgi:hypothetical protein
LINGKWGDWELTVLPIDYSEAVCPKTTDDKRGILKDSAPRKTKRLPTWKNEYERYLNPIITRDIDSISPDLKVS